MIAVFRSHTGPPFYMEGQRHETDVEFVERVTGLLIEKLEVARSAGGKVGLESFSVEFIFED